MKTQITAIVIFSALCTPLWAQDNDTAKGLAEAQFKQTDENGDGNVTLIEYAMQGENIFVSMDTDENGTVSLQEFVSWDYGIEELAEDMNKTQAYQGARSVLFNEADENADGELTLGEMDLFMASDFVNCDANRDGYIDMTEYLNNSYVNQAFRSALMPSYPS